MRKIISVCVDLTQGSIFNNALCEEYTNCYGLVISARCDLAHCKLEKFSYIPIVSIEDWICKDGFYIAKNRMKSEYLSTISNYLESMGKTKDMMNYISLEVIRDKVLSDSKKDKKAKNKIDKVIALDSHGKYEDLTIEKEDIDKLLKKIINELVKYSLTGYYFIEKVDNKEGYYVALLRELRFIPSNIVYKLSKGFIPTRKEEGLGILFEKEVETFLCCKLNSPFIEHLMQLFLLQYARIGIDDFKEVTNVFQEVGL